MSKEIKNHKDLEVWKKVWIDLSFIKIISNYGFFLLLITHHLSLYLKRED